MIIRRPNGNIETYSGMMTIEELESKYGKDSIIIPVKKAENPYYPDCRSDYEEISLEEKVYSKMFEKDTYDFTFNVNMNDICLREKDGDIKSITVNKKKRLVTVVFKDGDIQIAKCDENDVFDEYIGVLVCIAQRQFSSKTSMKRIINKFLNTKKNKKFNKEETKEIKKNKCKFLDK